MQRVTKDMTQVVRSMESALKSMNLEQISTMLDRFEKSFENLDVQSQVMEDTVGGVTAQSVPEGDVQVGLNVWSFLRIVLISSVKNDILATNDADGRRSWS